MPKKALVDHRPPPVSEHHVKETESFFQKIPLKESSSQDLSQDLSGFMQDLSGDSLNPLQDDSGFSKACQSGVSLQGWHLTQGEYVEGWLAQWCFWKGWCREVGCAQV